MGRSPKGEGRPGPVGVSAQAGDAPPSGTVSRGQPQAVVVNPDRCEEGARKHRASEVGGPVESPSAQAKGGYVSDLPVLLADGVFALSENSLYSQSPKQNPFGIWKSGDQVLIVHSSMSEAATAFLSLSSSVCPKTMTVTSRNNVALLLPGPETCPRGLSLILTFVVAFITHLEVVPEQNIQNIR